MKKNYFILFAILAIVLFQTCKPKQNLAGKNEKQTNNKQLANNDTVPISYVKNGNNQDTVKQEITQQKSVKDSVITEKIPVMNPKLYDPAYTIIDDSEDTEPEYNKLKTAPTAERKEILNFCPFLEKMYPGAKWYHDKYDGHELYVNRYVATYRGTEFLDTYINSFAYYFYDVGEISHKDLIKTAIYWILQPEYPNIIIDETKLIDEKKFDQFSTNKYYLTTGKINNDVLEVHTIINKDMICNFIARKNQKLIKRLISFI